MRAAKSLMPPRTGSEAVTLMGRLAYIARGVVYFLVGASAAIAVLSLGVATTVYLQRSREALEKENADRAAAEQQTRQVQAKQQEIDRLLADEL